LWNPGKLLGVHVDSTWNPGKMSQKGNFHARMHGILVESMLIPGSFHVESRKRFSVIICMEYMESMESVWIPHGFHMDSRQNYKKKMFVLEIQVDCMESIWIPHGFQATLSNRKNPKKSKKNILTMSA
jgi:hypothetical protein